MNRIIGGRREIIGYKLAMKIVVLSLLLSTILTACADNAPPVEVARRYLANMRDNNYTTAYDLLTSDSQLKVSRSQYVDRLNRARQEATIIKTEIVKVQEPSIVGKRASVPYQLEVTLQSGQKLNLFEAMLLLQQDTGWRVIWPPQG